MRDIKVTIAVCTRNKPDLIDSCLSSIISNSIFPTEIIVVDSSNQQNSNIVHNIANQYKAFYIYENRSGLSYARNRAVIESKGDIIVFTDDDCIVNSDFIQEHLSCYLQSNIACVTGRVINKNPKDLAFEKYMSQDRGNVSRNFSCRDKTVLSLSNYVSHATKSKAFREFAPIPWCFGSGNNMSFRRETFLKVGYFDENLGAGTPAKGGEDLDMFFRILCSGNLISYNPKAYLYHFHEHKIIHVAEDYGKGAGIFMRKYSKDPYIFAQYIGYFFTMAYGIISSIAFRDKETLQVRSLQLKGLLSSIFFSLA